MLLSTVFVLRPLAEGALPLTQGNAIHAWFLHLVHQHAPPLARWLHSQERRKPFTTSPLQGALTRQGVSARVRADHTYWLRVTSLDADLSAVLLAIAAAPPPRVRLFDMEFEVDTVTSQPQAHAWAGQSTYEHLYTQAGESPPAAQATLEFVSPTVFRSQGRNQLLPSPTGTGPCAPARRCTVATSPDTLLIVLPSCVSSVGPRCGIMGDAVSPRPQPTLLPAGSPPDCPRQEPHHERLWPPATN